MIKSNPYVYGILTLAFSWWPACPICMELCRQRLNYRPGCSIGVPLLPRGALFHFNFTPPPLPPIESFFQRLQGHRISMSLIAHPPTTTRISCFVPGLVLFLSLSIILARTTSTFCYGDVDGAGTWPRGVQNLRKAPTPPGIGSYLSYHPKYRTRPVILSYWFHFFHLAQSSCFDTMSANSLDALLGPALVKTSPWTLFDQAWTSVVGYPATEFRFTSGVTPMASLKEVLTGIILYYITIYTGWEFMRRREPFKLNTLFMIHNFILTVISGALLVLFLEQLVPSLWKYGLYNCMCSSPGWTSRLVVLYYLNYLTKYVELLDTVFLVLKKKPLTFLHTYHHGATAFLCYTQLIGRTPVSWVPITLNLTVHVVMYWYYFQSARGIRVSWKEWITRLQIIQFVLDLGFIYFATWDFHADKWGFHSLHIGRCEGELFAAITGCAVLSSYLVLFISFYIATYRKSSGETRKQGASKCVAKDQTATTTTGRAAETLKSARSRLGHASIDMVESSTKGQWAAARAIHRQHD